ncbi:MAG TPA: acyl-CoA desaturase, partial [Actinopolymorphaceae bacterium]|jgi:fatty acid desaturase
MDATLTPIGPGRPAPERAGGGHPGTERKQSRPRPASAYTDLARTIQGAGLMKRRYGYYWTRLLASGVALGAAVVGFVLIGDTWWQMLSAGVFAIVLTQIAFLGHDAGHHQIFKSGRWNEWVSLVLANLFVGISQGWWQTKHSRHHGNPNKIGSDPDIELPIISFTERNAARRSSRWTSWFITRQGWFFFPLLLIEGLDLHVSGLRRVFGPDKLKRRWVELAFLVLRLGGFVTMAFLILSPGKAGAFLGIQLALFGLYLGASFAPNHTGMPIVGPEARFDFLRRQVLMSRNISGGRWIDVGMGGLNKQIEHHLFPSMPRPALRLAKPIVEAYCREHDVMYTQMSLWRSYGVIRRYLNRTGLAARDPFTCPLVQQTRA